MAVSVALQNKNHLYTLLDFTAGSSRNLGPPVL